MNHHATNPSQATSDEIDLSEVRIRAEITGRLNAFSNIDGIILPNEEASHADIEATIGTIARSLTGRRSESIEHKLEALLKTTDDGEFSKAIRSLDGNTPKAVVKLLCTLAKGGQRHTHEVTIGSDENQEEYKVRVGGLRDPVRTASIDGITRLAECAKRLDEPLRLEAVPTLLEILESERGSLRYTAAKALKAIGFNEEHREPLTSLETMYSKGNSDVRESAAIALYAIAEELTPEEASSVAALLWSASNSSDERPSTRECSIGTIGKMLSSGVLDRADETVNQMRSSTEDMPRVRAALDRALKALS